MNKRLKKRELYSKDPLQQLFHHYVPVNKKVDDKCEGISKENEETMKSLLQNNIEKQIKKKRLSTLDQHIFVILTKPIPIKKLMVEAVI